MDCIHLGTPEYPRLLAEISDPPTCIWTRGDRALFSATAVAVIGARAASSEGLIAASEIAFDLARAGIVVVSGLARGIDAAAHRGALDAGGKTIAVLGTGIDRVYPAENDLLHQEIASSGLLITELAPGTPPLEWHFPRRNRIISGLSRAVVVVEARDTAEPIWREEVFGPVVAVLPFDDEADAVALANDTEYGLSGSIWTRDLGSALRVSQAVETGALSVNSHSSVRYWTPFGGMKQSGLGRELGPDALHSFTDVKNVFINTDS